MCCPRKSQKRQQVTCPCDPPFSPKEGIASVKCFLVVKLNSALTPKGGPLDPVLLDPCLVGVTTLGLLSVRLAQPKSLTPWLAMRSNLFLRTYRCCTGLLGTKRSAASLYVTRTTLHGFGTPVTDTFFTQSKTLCSERRITSRSGLDSGPTEVACIPEVGSQGQAPVRTGQTGLAVPPNMFHPALHALGLTHVARHTACKRSVLGHQLRNEAIHRGQRGAKRQVGETRFCFIASQLTRLLTTAGGEGCVHVRT